MGCLYCILFQHLIFVIVEHVLHASKVLLHYDVPSYQVSILIDVCIHIFECHHIEHLRDLLRIYLYKVAEVLVYSFALLNLVLKREMPHILSDCSISMNFSGTCYSEPSMSTLCITGKFLTFVISFGFEPKTYNLEGCCSIQLSYEII